MATRQAQLTYTDGGPDTTRGRSAPYFSNLYLNPSLSFPIKEYEWHTIDWCQSENKTLWDV